MSASISRHLVANVLGRAWSFLATFVFIPVYLNILGVEGFGVIALFLAVSVIIAFLDFGLSPTLARELHDQHRGATEKLNLLFTYEVAFASIIGLTIVLALALPEPTLSIFIAERDQDRPLITSSIRLVFVAAACQLLMTFYIAGLMGVERQIEGNVLLIASGIVRNAVVILPLWLFPHPSVYLLWQSVGALLFSFLTRRALYRALDADRYPDARRFSRGLALKNFGFSGGMFLISVTAALNTQFDKVVVGKLSGIASLAEYSLVSTFGQLLIFVISPITITLQPRLVRAASRGDAAEVRRLFLTSHRLVAALTCATLGTMVQFGPLLIGIWTAGKIASTSVANYVVPISVGYSLLALQAIPHCVSVAYKNLRGALAIGVSLLFSLPTYWFATMRFGPAGAAFTWLVLQAVVAPLYVAWVDKRFLQLESPLALMASTVAVPVLISLSINHIASFMVNTSNHALVNLGIIGAAAALSAVMCVALALKRGDWRVLTETNQRERHDQ